jgi:hypothetical protein
MKLIDLKPVKRCQNCGHLIPDNYDSCPYCEGKVGSFASNVKPVTVKMPEPEPEPERVPRERKPLDPKTKKMILIAGIAVVVLIAGFFGVRLYMSMHRLDKPITEVLSQSEVNALSEDDPTFAAFYEQVGIIRESIVTQADKEKFGKITYREMKSFLQMYSNENYCTRLKNEAKNQYEVQYRQPILPQLNAIIAKWKQFEDDHNPNNYLKVVTHTLYTADAYGDTGTSVWFDLKYPKGTITDCSVYCYCKSNTNDEIYFDSGQYVDLSIMLNNNAADNTHFITSDYHSTDFWDNWSFVTEVKSVTLPDNSIITIDDTTQVPEEVRNFLKESTPENECKVVKAQLNPNYPSFDQFASESICNELKEQDPLCFELVEIANASIERIPRGWYFYRPGSE